MEAGSLVVYLIKFCMCAIFVLWVWKHRHDDKLKAAEAGASLGNAASPFRALLFSIPAFAVLAGVFEFCSIEGAPHRAALYLFSLFLTLLLECGFAALWGYRAKTELLCVALCSLVTHPVLHLIMLLPKALFGEDAFDDHWIWYLEAMVVVAESCILNSLLPGRRSVNAKLALSMNAFSFFGGLVIMLGILFVETLYSS
ncbi:hypothetical protein FACS1894187_19050 [Synergistales bacterium]|nr:hypothetical protein FACS1894187_19050 [Synergistales bacterium]